MAEFYYNSQYYFSMNMSPTRATYGFDPWVDWFTKFTLNSLPTLQQHLSALCDSILNLQYKLSHAQELAKQFVNKKRHFKYKEGEMVFSDQRFIKTP